MKLAASLFGVPGETFSEKLRNAERYGFEGVEVSMAHQCMHRLETVKEVLSTSKMRVSTLFGGPGGDLLGPDRKARETAINKLKERLNQSAELGAIGVIAVPTFGRPKISDLYPWRTNVREVEKEILVEECKILGKYAEDVGAHVILEPLNRYETHFIRRLEHAVEICDAVGMEHVKIMADFFHMNIEEADIPSSIEKAADYIVHVHLADSNRVLPGYGHTDFKSGFAALKRTGYENFMALECRIPGDPEVELPKCVEHLRQFI